VKLRMSVQLVSVLVVMQRSSGTARMARFRPSWIGDQQKGGRSPRVLPCPTRIEAGSGYCQTDGMTLTRADLVDLDAETVRDTAACYGLDCDNLTDDQVFTEFADLLDSLGAIHGE
jgi:hypothetical protein